MELIQQLHHTGEGLAGDELVPVACRRLFQGGAGVEAVAAGVVPDPGDPEDQGVIEPGAVAEEQADGGDPVGLRPLLVAGGNDAVRPLFQGGEHGVDIGGLMGVVPVHDAHQVPGPGPLEEIPHGGVQHAPQVPVHLVGNHPHRGVFRRQAGDEG